MIGLLLRSKTLAISEVLRSMRKRREHRAQNIDVMSQTEPNSPAAAGIVPPTARWPAAAAAVGVAAAAVGSGYAGAAAASASPACSANKSAPELPALDAGCTRAQLPR